MKILVRHNYTKEKINNNNNKEKIKFIAIEGCLDWIIGHWLSDWGNEGN